MAGASHRAPRKAKSGSKAAAKPAPKAKKASSGPRTRVGEEESRDKAKARKGALFMAAVLAVNMLWIVVSGQFDEFVHALHNAEAGWFVAGLLVMGLNFAFGSLAFVLAAYIDPDSPLGLRDCMSVEANGVLFGNLTPMMAGSVPGQIWRLVKSGLGFGAASAVQITRFLMFQLAEIVLGGVLLALTWGHFYAQVGTVMFVNLAIFAFKAAQMAVLLAACLFPDWVTKVALSALDLVDRRNLFGLRSRTEGWRSSVRTQVARFSSTFRTAVRHRGTMAVMLAFSMAQQACLWASPWFVLQAFGIRQDPLLTCAAGSLVQFVASSIPLPGGTGGVEASFALFLGPVFGSSATAGYLVWRLVTFYGYTALCGAATMVSTKPSSPTVRQRMRGLVGRLGS